MKYIEIDKQKYQDSMIYLSQQQLLVKNLKDRSPIFLPSTPRTNYAQPTTNPPNQINKPLKEKQNNLVFTLPSLSPGSFRNKFSSFHNDNNKNMILQNDDLSTFSDELAKLNQPSLHVSTAGKDTQLSSFYQSPKNNQNTMRNNSTDFSSTNQSRMKNLQFKAFPDYLEDSAQSSPYQNQTMNNTTQNNSFFSTIPFNEDLYEKLAKDSKEAINEFMKDLIEGNTSQSSNLSSINKNDKNNSNSKENPKGKMSGFKKFATENFDANALQRLKTFFKFAFSSTDKTENKQITNALEEFLESYEAQGTMQIIDLWSGRSLKQCIDRTNMGNEKAIIQSFLYYKAKFEMMKKEKEKEMFEQLSKNKEQLQKIQSSRRVLDEQQAREKHHLKQRTSIKNIFCQEKSLHVIEEDNKTKRNMEAKARAQSLHSEHFKSAIGEILENIQYIKEENLSDIKESQVAERDNKDMQKQIDKHFKSLERSTKDN